MTVSSERINKLLQHIDGASYLEVGVQEGKTFHKVRADQKVAVDPDFLFDVDQSRVNFPHCHYFEVTSDDYFLQNIRTASYDLIFLDGLHVHNQTYRDFCNAIECLENDKSIIIIDDTFPIDVFSAHTDNRKALLHRKAYGTAANGWHGDVYKTMLYIAAFHPSFDYFTITGTNQKSQTILWRPKSGIRKNKDMCIQFQDIVQNIHAADYLWLLDNINVLNPVSTFEDGFKLLVDGTDH
jgi:hypothetical protein